MKRILVLIGLVLFVAFTPVTAKAATSSYETIHIIYNKTANYFTSEQIFISKQPYVVDGWYYAARVPKDAWVGSIYLSSKSSRSYETCIAEYDRTCRIDNAYEHVMDMVVTLKPNDSLKAYYVMSKNYDMSGWREIPHIDPMNVLIASKSMTNEIDTLPTPKSKKGYIYRWFPYEENNMDAQDTYTYSIGANVDFSGIPSISIGASLNGEYVVKYVNKKIFTNIDAGRYGVTYEFKNGSVWSSQKQIDTLTKSTTAHDYVAWYQDPTINRYVVTYAKGEFCMYDGWAFGKVESFKFYVSNVMKCYK